MRTHMMRRRNSILDRPTRKRHASSAAWGLLPLSSFRCCSPSRFQSAAPLAHGQGRGECSNMNESNEFRNPGVISADNPATV